MLDAREQDVPVGCYRVTRGNEKMVSAMHFRVTGNLKERARRLASMYHLNISAFLQGCLETWLDGIESDPEASVMDAWNAGFLVTSRVVKDATGDMTGAIKKWARNKTGDGQRAS